KSEIRGRKLYCSDRKTASPSDLRSLISDLCLLMLRNILICTTQVPFTKGGAESHVAGLRHALIEAGYHAEVVALPFKWYPPTEIMRGGMGWPMLDVRAPNGTPIELVIGVKCPASLGGRVCKVL